MSRNDPRKWYGTFRAVVVDVDDPKFLDRVRVRMPEVLGDMITDWAWPKSAVVNCSWKPIVGSRVWVEFENGDIDRPLYSGSWFPLDKNDENKSLIPSEVLENNGADYTRTRIIKSPAGHKILVKDPDPDDAAAEKGITIQTVGGHKIKLSDETPALTITHSNGTSKIEIDSAGKVTITSNGDVAIQGSAVTIDNTCKIGGGGGNIVTTLHTCAFTGGVHPAGSSKAEAPI